MRKLSFLSTILIPIVVCKSQQVQGSYSPDYYSSSFLTYEALINPAFTNNNQQEKASLNTLYKSRTGPLNEVAFITAYADVCINLRRKTTQVIRILLQNEQEGPYISSPKFFGNYAVKIPIQENVSLSLGLALGMSSLNFTAPSGMGSARVLDGNVGSIFKYKKTTIGIASYQIFNSRSVALNGTLLFKRFYQFHIQSELEINELFSVKGSLSWRPQPLIDLANATAALCYKETITFGLMYQLKRGTSFLTSIQLKQGKNPLLLNFSYNSPFLNSFLIPTSSFEIGLQYKIKQS